MLANRSAKGIFHTSKNIFPRNFRNLPVLVLREDWSVKMTSTLNEKKMDIEKERSKFSNDKEDNRNSHPGQDKNPNSHPQGKSKIQIFAEGMKKIQILIPGKKKSNFSPWNGRTS